MQASLESICAHPESAPLVQRDIRRRLLRRFPYGLFYRLIQGQVVVVACFHAKRSPRASAMSPEDWVNRICNLPL